MPYIQMASLRIPTNCWLKAQTMWFTRVLSLSFSPIFCYWRSNIGQCVISLRWGTIIFLGGKKLCVRAYCVFYMKESFIIWVEIFKCCQIHWLNFVFASTFFPSFHFWLRKIFHAEMALTKVDEMKYIYIRKIWQYSIMVHHGQWRTQWLYFKENEFRLFFARYTFLWISKQNQVRWDLILWHICSNILPVGGNIQ